MTPLTSDGLSPVLLNGSMPEVRSMRLKSLEAADAAWLKSTKWGASDVKLVDARMIDITTLCTE